MIRPIRGAPVACLLLVAAMAGSLCAQGRTLTERRKALVKIVSEGVKDPRVLKAIGDTPRHLFVSARHRKNAYFDMAIPIGSGATISPPYVVGFMTEQLLPKPTDKVLEIGTGSGYQAAILSPLVKEVYSIEIVESLGKSAASRLKRLGYKNIRTKVGDGYKGWPEHAPFDKIIVTCSPEKIPQPLIDQLREGGRMVIPLGQRYQQALCLVTKSGGKLKKEILESTFFIPMTGTAEELRVVKNDSAPPALVNGGFEQLSSRKSPLGWYYLRQMEAPEAPNAPEGKRVIVFQNQTPGRASQALQAVGVNGRRFRELEVSFWVRTTDAQTGAEDHEVPQLQLRFYDERRNNVGTFRLGPYLGTTIWTKRRGVFRIPGRARLAVMGIGLFGATGEAQFDDVRLEGRTKVTRRKR